MSVFYDLNKTPRNILNQAIVRAIVSENNGALFDPSDLSTLYQDAAGTTPVTAVEQPVGLWLDKSRGLMLGPELVSNGDFSVDEAGFTAALQSTIAVSSGRLRVTATGTNPYVQRVLPSIAGKHYKITIDIYTGTASQASNTQLVVSSTATLGDANLFLGAYTGLPYKRYEVIVLSTTNNIYLKVRNGATPIGTYFELDNVSVKELYGYHATQSITASRPTLSARYNLLTKTEDFADAVWGSEINLTATNNTAIAPDGTLTADTLTTTAVTHAKFQSFTCSPKTQYTFSFYAKRGTMTDAKYSVYNLTGGVDIVAATSYYSAINADTFSRISITFTTPENCVSCRVYPLRDSGVVGTVFVWGADVRIGLPGPYQRVNTATYYDTDERYFPKYLKFSSTVALDDFMNLPYMGLYANGSASIVCARDAVSQSNDTYIISERSTTDADPKYFPSRQLANGGNMDAYISDNAGTVVLDTTGSAFSGASDAVVRSVIDTGNNIKLLKNGQLAANDNYIRAGALTLNNTTIGASVSTTTSNYVVMKLYGLIITKSALTDAQRIRCERYLGRKSGVRL